jgi:hypothetical protein
MFLPTYHGTAYGLNATYYFNSFDTDSWYLNAHVYKENYDSYPHAYLGSYTYDGTSFIGTVGVHQISTIGISVLFGFGAHILNAAVTEKPDNSPAINSNNLYVLPYVEFKAGYLF